MFFSQNKHNNIKKVMFFSLKILKKNITFSDFRHNCQKHNIFEILMFFLYFFDVRHNIFEILMFLF